MFTTKNNLSVEVRRSMIDLLNQRLSDCIDLQTQMKQAHWNVKGPDFISLHKLFDEINESVEDYVDDLAERAVQLGGVAKGTARTVAQVSSLPEYPASAIEGLSHVVAVSTALGVFGASVRTAINTAHGMGDEDTSTLFCDISRGIDKWLWFVEAHLQASR